MVKAKRPIVLRDRWMLVPVTWFEVLPESVRRSLLDGGWLDDVEAAITKPKRPTRRKGKRARHE